jgi:multidrug resistance protein
MMQGLLLVVFVNFVGVGALIPVLPYAVIDEAGASETVMTLLLASFALAMMVGSPILGRLSDYFGRRRVLLGSILFSVIGHVWFAMTTDITMMFFARILAGLASGSIGVIQAIITDTTAPEQRARAMGLLGAFVGFGFVSGPAIGGLLSGYGEAVHTAPFLLAGALALTGFVIAIFFVPESKGDTPPRQLSWIRRFVLLRMSGLLMFALAVFLLNLAFAQIEASFTLVLKDVMEYSSRQTGYVFTWVGVIIIVVQGILIGPITRRLTELGTSAAGAFLLVVGQVMTVVMVGYFLGFFEPSFWPMIICTTLVCTGFALANPTVTSAASQVIRKNEVGGIMGVIQGMGSLGQVLGLICSGPLYEIGGGMMTFGFGGLVSFLLLLVISNMIWYPRRRRHSRTAQASKSS